VATQATPTGTLPNGLSFSPLSGVLSGTPTQAGTFSFSVSATDSTTGTGAPFFIVNNYTLAVSAPTVVVDPTTLPAATGGVAYSQTITASGGSGTYTFSLSSGALPTGMSFNSAGLLSGTPTAAGTFNITVQATDGNGFTGSRSYSLVVNAPTITLAPAMRAARVAWPTARNLPPAAVWAAIPTACRRVHCRRASR